MIEDKDVIKALGLCTSEYLGCEDGCPYIPREIGDDFCADALKKDALDLINRQQAEIENLTVNMNAFGRGMQIEAEKVKTAKAEAIKEFAEKTTEIFMRYAHIHNYADIARRDYIEAGDGHQIEMQSVWDAFMLKKYGMSEYEEMHRLQRNIETIEKDRLLTELEKDFRLLAKEMVGDAE